MMYLSADMRCVQGCAGQSLSLKRLPAPQPHSLVYASLFLKPAGTWWLSRVMHVVQCCMTCQLANSLWTFCPGFRCHFERQGVALRSTSLLFTSVYAVCSQATKAGLLDWVLEDAIPLLLGDPDSSHRQVVTSCAMALIAMLFGALLMHFSSRNLPHSLSVESLAQSVHHSGAGSLSQTPDNERSVSGRSVGPSRKPNNQMFGEIMLSGGTYDGADQGGGRQSWGGQGSMLLGSELCSPERLLNNTSSRVSSFLGSDEACAGHSASQSAPETAMAYSQLKAQYDQLLMTSSLTSPEVLAGGGGLGSRNVGGGAGGGAGGSNRSNAGLYGAGLPLGAQAPVQSSMARKTGNSSSSSNNRQAVMQSGFLHGAAGARTPTRLLSPQMMQQNFNQELRNLQSYIGSGSGATSANSNQNVSEAQVMGAPVLSQQPGQQQQPQIQLQQQRLAGSLSNDGPTGGQLLRSMFSNTTMREEAGHGGSASSINSSVACFAQVGPDSSGVVIKVSHHRDPLCQIPVAKLQPDGHTKHVSIGFRQ